MDKLNPILTGYGAKLRLANVDDAEFILTLRNMPHVKGKMGDLDISVEQEKNWLNKNIIDPSDYFFVIETQTKNKVGTIGVYNINKQKSVAEAGRLAVLPNSLLALPACFMLYDFCFQTLHLSKLYAWVVKSNVKVISFDKMLGYKEIQDDNLKTNLFLRMDNNPQAVYLELDREDWSKKRLKLISILQAAFHQ